MSQPLHTGAAVVDSCLSANWLAPRCQDCNGTGELHVRSDGITFVFDDTPCDGCNGSGFLDVDEPEDPEDADDWLPGVDNVADWMREGLDR